METKAVCRLQHGVDYAFGELPGKLPFLKGLSQMCSRLPAKQAELLMGHMQQALGQQSPKEDDPEWEDYWDFLAIAQDRTSKGAHPRSALKGKRPSAHTTKNRLHMCFAHVTHAYKTAVVASKLTDSAWL